MVDHVAGREHALDVRRRRAGLRHEVAGLVVVELVEKELRGRVVADGDEETVRGNLEGLVRLDVAQANAGELAVFGAESLLDDERGQELDLVVRACAIEHDRRRTELVTTVDDRHLRGELREEDRLLHR